MRYLHDNSSMWMLPLPLILLSRYLPQLLCTLVCLHQCHLQMPLMNLSSYGKVLACVTSAHTHFWFISKISFYEKFCSSTLLPLENMKENNLNLIVCKLAELSELIKSVAKVDLVCSYCVSFHFLLAPLIFLNKEVITP